MKKLTFSTVIKAPKERVWHTMLDQDTYREWTKAFNEGSRYEGTWETGSEMRFVGVDEQGKEAGGMYSKIKEVRPYEFVSIEHLGVINEKGEIDTTSEAVKKWAPAFENYTLTEKEDGTGVVVEINVSDEWEDMFNQMWPKALGKLGEICRVAGVVVA